jgi:hypothetical protein
MFSAICLWRSARLGGTPAPQRTSGTGAIALRDYLCIKQASASLRLTKAKYVLHPDAGHIVGCVNDQIFPGVRLLGQDDTIVQFQHAAIRLHGFDLVGITCRWKHEMRQDRTAVRTRAKNVVRGKRRKTLRLRARVMSSAKDLCYRRSPRLLWNLFV